MDIYGTIYSIYLIFADKRNSIMIKKVSENKNKQTKIESLPENMKKKDVLIYVVTLRKP